jgi:hypothetical protein
METGEKLIPYLHEYKESFFSKLGSRRKLDNARVEAGSNTSTVTLRVVAGDEKGSLESETAK